MDEKTVFQNAQSRRFFEAYLPIDNILSVRQNDEVDGDRGNFLSPNFSKFAVECN